jgi:cytidylate kinase
MSDARHDDARLLAAIDRLERLERPQHDRAVAAAAEQQMQRWLLEHRGQAKGTPAAAGDSAASIGPYVAISREAGAGGSQTSRLLGEILGWNVLDGELIECMAETYHTSPAMLELVDEKTTNSITEVFKSLREPHSLSQLQYVSRASRMIFMAAHTGKVIFVGRGAGFILPGKCGLSVRLIAGHKYRVQQIMERRHLSFKEAEDYVTKTDADRHALAQQYFHRDASDPHVYDMVINVERFGPQLAARQIADAVASCLHLDLPS